MTVKQKVNYSVQYDSSTDTLSTQLNILLNRIVTLIRTNNSDLLELTRITYGSEEMNGAPMYDSGTTKEFESDVVFLGTDTDNIVLSLCFYKGRLVISMNMDPSVEALHVANWENLTKGQSTAMSLSNLPYCTARACKWYNNNSYNAYNINIPYIILNNTIEFDVVYWTGDYSSGYMFYNVNRVTNGVDLVIYKTLEHPSGTQGLGACLWCYSSATDSYNNIAPSEILAWSFEENLANNMPSRIYTGNSSSSTYPGYMPNLLNNNLRLPYSESSTLSNSKYELRQWFQVNDCYGCGMASIHTLGSAKGSCGALSTKSDPMPTITSVSTTDPSNNNFMSPLLTAYNLPYLNSDECYLRRMRIPGFNKYCKGEIYLFYTPTTTPYNSGDIISVDGKQFAVINTGIVCYVARVN